MNPVVEGITRAKLDNDHKGDVDKICPILIHGDASLAGQGVVYEVQQMSGLKAYQTGGTVHVVINNQIGFTTNFADGRTSTYCTDVAKVTLCPVFHVNGDDVEAVVYAVNMAMEYRQKFDTDVYVDLLGYRKYGHNEGDEPRFTQPLLYKLIEQHPNPREIYKSKLESSGAIEASLAKEMEQGFRQMLQERLNESKESGLGKVTNFIESYWKGLGIAHKEDFQKPSPNTKVTQKLYKELAKNLRIFPKILNPLIRYKNYLATEKL